MKFLVYTANPLDNNATLDSFEQGADKDITRIINLLEDMSLDRVMENQTVSLLVNNIEYNKRSGIVTADIYKQTNPGKALHQLAEDGGGVTVQEIISEHEDAFVQGIFGMKKVDSEVHLIVESNFGSFFVASCKGMNITPHYSSKTIQSIQESETIGRTTLDFDDDFDLTASLFKPPEDGDIREEKGFGNVDIANKLTAVLNISQAHRMSLDIGRDEWLANVDVFEALIESGIVTTIRVENTKDGIVKLGEGGERAIRKKISTNSFGDKAVKEAFKNLSMILNLIRTILELGNYLDKIRYPKSRIFVYSTVSIVFGVILSNSSRAADLPVLSVTAILFGFTINAVVMLGNSSEHYLSDDTKHSDQLEKYYEKSLYISIHTLGIGIVTIIVTGVFQLFPNFNIFLMKTQQLGHTINVELLSTTVYTLSVYYLIVFSIVIASAAELVKIRV